MTLPSARWHDVPYEGKCHFVATHGKDCIVLYLQYVQHATRMEISVSRMSLSQC